jgi:gliding motility-associated-like protein
VPGTLTITKGLVTVNADNQSRVYGVANPTLTMSYSGFANGENSSVINTLPTATSPAILTSNAGAYAITPAGGIDDNYDFNYVPGTLTITKGLVTVNADNQSRVYGVANPTLTMSYSGFANGENSSVINTLPTATSPAIQSRVYGVANPTLTMSYSGFANGENSSVINTLPTATSPAILTSNAGTYAITPAGGIDDNYDFNYVPGTLTITKGLVTVNADNQSRVYGVANPTLTMSYSGFANGENSSVINTLPTATSPAILTSNAGTYAITPAGGIDDNYDFNYVPGTLTITKGLVTVNADNQSRVYGVANPTLTMSYSGFANGENSSVINTLPTATSPAILTSNVGAYAITPAGGIDDNYDFNYVPGTLTITKGLVTVNADNQSRVYGVANPTLTMSYSGFANGENSSVINTLPTATSPAMELPITSNVGAYAITPAGGIDDNYDFNYVPGTLTITKGLVTVNADNQSRVYGVANPTLTMSYSGFANGENSSVINTLPTATSPAILTSNVGAYAITPAGGIDDNYDFNYVPGTLTITKGLVTVNADNQSRVYGVANPTLTMSYSGFANGENSSVINTLPTATSPAILTSNAGTYAITPAGGIDDNYDFNYVAGSLTITKATLTATVDNQSKTYGAVNPAFTISYTGFANSETSSVLETPPTASAAIIPTSPVGTYPITASGGLDNNYLFSFSPGTLTITKASLTATAVNASRLYGAANPSFTINYVGFLNGENSSALDMPPTTSTTAGPGSDVGTYPISVVGGSGGNYTITPVAGTLTITKATVTATAENKTRVYNSANPTFTIVYTGFVNGDNSSFLDTPPVASSAANLSSPVGNYPITVAGGSDINYAFTYVSGQLTITKATPIVSWATPASITYGTPLSTTQLNATASVAGTYSYNMSIGTILNVSTTHVLSVNFTPSDATNYNSVNGTTVVLEVTKATLTATPNNQTRLYGAANPAFPISYAGFVNSETFLVLNTQPLASSAAGSTSPVGPYPIVASGGLDNNYEIVYVQGTLTITKANVTAIAVNASRVYGSLNPLFTINYTGFVNGENSSVLDTAPTASTAATSTSAAGTYPITVSGGSDINYTFSYTPGTLTITKATVTATASDASRVYGVANPTFSIAYSGFVLGENSSVLNILPVANSPATLTSNVGVYPINVSGGSDNNYSFVYEGANLTITKATPVITWANPSAITYGTPLTAIQLNATASTPEAGTFVYVPGSGTILNAGNQVLSVNFTPSSADAVNYNPVNGTTVSIIVNKATPVITWPTPAGITYGTALSGTQLNATASISGGTFVYAPGLGTILNAGNQVLSVNFTPMPADIGNYNPVNGTTVSLIVNKATPVITWPTPAGITYGTALSGTQLNATASISGGTFVYAPGLGTILNAGNQVLSVNFTPKPADAANYNPVNGTTVSLIVNKATPTVTWAPPGAIAYGTPLSGTQLNATASVPGSFIYTPATGTILNAGANQILTVNFNPSDAANYNSVNGTTVVITVNKATPTITWPAPAAITYGTALSATQLNATSSVPGTIVYTPTLGTFLNAGVNQILALDFSPTDAANYNPVINVQRLITVNKANPIITWANPAPIIYGTPLSSTQLNASANVPGVFVYNPVDGTILNVGVNRILSLNFTPTDNLNYNAIIGRTATITVNKATPIVTWTTPLPIKINEPLNATQLNATASVPGSFVYTPSVGTSFGTAGTYPLTVAFTPSDATNYNSVPSTQVQITVNNKDNPVVTWDIPAAITYGATLSASQLNATASVPGTFTYTPPLGTLLNSGVGQTLSVNFVPTDGINYNSVNRSVLITVNKANLTATGVSTSRIYGASNPTFAITYSGFVNSENIGVIDTAPLASCSAIAGDNAGGTFPIIPSGGVDNNYTFTYVNGTLTITKAPLTAKADDKSRSYGLANPAFTISYTGFVNGDTDSEITKPTAATVATPLSNVGTYPISLTGGSALNYNITLQTGQLTVNISPLIARAADVARIYGQANPTLSIVYIGFLNGDNASSITPPTISTTATPTSAVGTYPITLSGGAALNYGIILQPGTLTVNKATVLATANNQTRLYGVANPALTISYTGFVNSETASVLDVLPVTATAATPLSGVGSYLISISGGSDNNYTLTYANGTLSITKSTLTATAVNASRLYGSANPAFVVNIAGFRNGENQSVIDALPVATSATTLTSIVGSYSITVSGGTDNNYTFTYTPATLTISKAPLIATAANASRPYGTSNPAFIINYSGFVNSETSTVLDTAPIASTTAIVASPVGNYPINVTAGLDNNYSITPVNGTLSIVKANPIITWTNPTAIIYGTPLSGTQLNASANVPGAFVYTPANGTVLNAGSGQTLTANFNPTDATNYNPVIGTSVSIAVNKAIPVVTWSNPATITYGTALSSTQLNATANVPGSFAYTPTNGTVLNAGSNQVLSANFTPTDVNNYQIVNNSTVLISVNKATPVITWLPPSAITFGTPLGATQLNASANVPGTFTYTPASGTVLNAGANQNLSASFSPTNATNYNPVTGISTQITVNKANPVITWPTPLPIVYGTPLSATQLNATASTAGTFTYTPPSGTILNVGANQILSVNFVPTNSSNFNTINSTTVLLTVTKSVPIITWTNPGAITYGTVLSSTQLNATANVPGVFTYTPAVGTLLNAGANQVLSADFMPTNAVDYSPVLGTTVMITVNKTNLTATANNLTKAYGEANPPLAITYTGFVNGEIPSVLDVLPTAITTATTSSSVNSYPIIVSGGQDNNYTINYAAGSLTITKAILTATADNQSRLLGTPNPILTISYTGFVTNDGVGDIDIVPTVTTTAITSSPVGVYPIALSGGSDNNYSLNLVAGTLTVTPNFPPTINNFEITTKEDEQFNFTYTMFGDNFNSFSGSTIQYIKVVTLPANGKLFWKGAVVSIGAEITITNGAFDNFFYLPNADFAGSDSFRWNAFEGTYLAPQDATVAIKITKVNDVPVLANIETTSILYSLGDPAVLITKSTIINDVDDNFIFSAKVAIAENFAQGDLLSMETGLSLAITSSYNKTTGELELKGKDSRANYETALTKVLFSSPVSGASIISDKRIDLVVKDSLDNSNVISRIVSITEVFPELDIVTAFTPNDDGVNDTWDFVNLDFYSEIRISVFDRNSRSVFECSGKDCAWDGKLNGKVLAPGPYFYTIYLNGGKRKYQGTVTLLR